MQGREAIADAGLVIGEFNFTAKLLTRLVDDGAAQEPPWDL